MATMLAPIIGAIAASKTVTCVVGPSTPINMAKIKRMSAGASTSLNRSPAVRAKALPLTALSRS